MLNVRFITDSRVEVWTSIEKYISVAVPNVPIVVLGTRYFNDY